MLKEFQTILVTEHFSVIYDTKTDIIEKKDNYRINLSEEKIRDYRECYNRDKAINIKEYNQNIDIVVEIYKEMTTKEGLERLVKVFPKRRNGLFDIRKVMSICRCMNTIPMWDTPHGYVCNELRVKAINSRVLEIEYKEQKFWF